MASKRSATPQPTSSDSRSFSGADDRPLASGHAIGPGPRVTPVLILLLTLSCGALVAASGVDLWQTARIFAVVLTQVATGAVLWRLTRGPIASHLSEMIGMGLALGTLTSLMSAQLLIATPLAQLAWLLPTAVLAAAFARSRVRRRFRSGSIAPVGLDEAATVAFGVGVGLIFVWSFWRRHPLQWEGWWSYYVDIPFHEALATSISTWGPNDSILVAGEPIRYHWFAHAWSGLTTHAAGAGSFVVVTRVLPLIALIGVVCLTWAWSRRMSSLRSVPFLAVLVATLAMDVGSRQPLTLVSNLTVSPSMGIAAVWLLASAVIFTEHLAGRLTRPEPLLFLTSLGCLGGKVSTAAVLVGGVGLVAIMSVVMRTSRTRIWVDAATVLVATAVGYVALLVGSDGRLAPEFGASATAYRFLPDDGRVGIAVGTVAVLLAIAAKWAGLVSLLASRSTRARPEALFGLGAALTGLLLVSVLGHPGSSQLYFSLSAGVVIAVICGWGFGQAVHRLPPRTVLVSVLVGLIAGFGGLASRGGFVDAATALPRWLWLAPLAVWLPPLLLCVLVTSGVLGHARRPTRQPTAVAVSAAAISLVVSSLTFGLLVLTDTIREPPPTAPSAGAPLAWTDDHVAALTWLREHSDVDDIVATNRQCSGARPTCDTSRWFLGAAISQRRMFVEGSAYAVDTAPLPRWVKDRIALSRNFVDEPTEQDTATLWNAGVRWVVVDLASTETRSWSPYARKMRENEVSVILRLNRPGGLGSSRG